MNDDVTLLTAPDGRVHHALDAYLWTELLWNIKAEDGDSLWDFEVLFWERK